jgi:hypothetical protein
MVTVEAVLEVVMEHGLEALESIPDRLPWKERRVVQVACEALEQALEALSPAQATRLAEHGEASELSELSELERALETVRGLLLGGGSGGGGGEWGVEAVNRLQVALSVCTAGSTECALNVAA